jgi:hypothetical protein
MPLFDTNELIEAIVRDAKIPAGSTYRTPSVLLNLATAEMNDTIVPALLSVGGNYLMDYKDMALTAGKTRFRLPPRCLRPERVQIVDADGNVKVEAVKEDPDRADIRYTQPSALPPRLGSEVFWYFSGSNIIIRKPSDLPTTYFLRIHYRRQPNRLVEVGSQYGGTIIEVESDEAYILRFKDATEAGLFYTNIYGLPLPVDIIFGTPNFDTNFEDESLVTATNGSPAPGQMQVSIAPPAALSEIPAIGDYICSAGYSCVPQIPVAYHSVLASFAAARVLREMEELDAAVLARQEAQEKLERAKSTIAPRAAEPEPIVNTTWD